MKVVLVSNEKSDVPGGENIFMMNLINGLSEHGFEFEICNTGLPPSHRSFFDKALEYSRLQSLSNVYGKVRKIKDYDALHFLNASCCLAGLPKKGVKIATSHILGKSHYRFYEPRGITEGILESAYHNYSSLMDRVAFNSMDCIVASSPYHAGDIHETYGVPRSKIEVIPPGIDLLSIKKSPKTDLRSKYDCDHVIVYVGRTSGFRKGLQYLIDAVDKNAPYKVLVIGGGLDERYFKELVKEKGLESKIIFLGYLDFKQKTMIQKSADATIVPSVSESFCMVFAESLACGVPVVAFDMPFWKPLYSGAGLFVERDGLAEGIGRILTDARLRKKITARGSEIVKSYDIKKTVSDYMEFYESLCR